MPLLEINVSNCRDGQQLNNTGLLRIDAGIGCMNCNCPDEGSGSGSGSGGGSSSAGSTGSGGSEGGTVPYNFRFSGSADIHFELVGLLDIDWGDGSPGQEFVDESVSHTYPDNGTYDVLVSGAPTELTLFNMGNLRSVAGLPDTLQVLDIGSNPMEDVDITNLNALTSFSAEDCLLEALDISGNPLLVNLHLIGNELPSSVVNAILAQLVANGLSGGTVQLNGQFPSAPPTGQGIIDAATLVSNGWTVTTD